MKQILSCVYAYYSLNESPSEKEGKCDTGNPYAGDHNAASMKAPPKRKGNFACIPCFDANGKTPQ